MPVYQGKLDATGMRVAVVVSRFNDLVTKQLLEGATNCLERHGLASEGLVVVWVPGALEIPVAAKRLAQSGAYDAVVCLGAVIRGATAHFEYVAGETASGVARVGLDSGVPVIFGVLTTDTIEQALERAGTKAGNKGFDAALTAIEMANVLRQVEGSLPGPGGGRG